MEASLKPLKITGYKDGEFKTPFTSDPYEAMINPESIKWDRAIAYNELQIPNSSSSSQKYQSTPSDKIQFDIIIDCTGVVNSKRLDMADEINALKTIMYSYQGGKHRPNFVKIQWGKSLIFKGVLTSFDTTYTFFRPDGSPLRAKISLSFKEYFSFKTLQRMQKKQSPDVTHLVTVVQGMNLPQLCQSTWDDDSAYIHVARFNSLNKFRNLKGIEKLVLPPIIQP